MSKRLRRILKTSEDYRAYRSVVKRIKQLADFDNLTNEMEHMHKQRKSRELHLKSPTVDRIIKAAAQNSSYRSRVVEIMVNVQKAQRTLDSAIKRIENYILSEYKQYIDGRSIAERQAVIKNLLSGGYYQLADFDRIVEMCKTFIDDIDQNSWTLKHMLDGLQLLYTRENIVQTSKNRSV